ncbi:signal transduction histidine kinase [Algoriphagus ratkowskyi]|uniref:histidine kinase n=1 Tax=Algoriphagus ratkowskyi TaxID=57028 RepID=A0A2W7RN98_9BACT|nr:HAMP domain-containing sensor histidine kinase [Algoriphagus ratkowskyi]PZX55939.1 signal transduction histidine kinase [Algoriphagus ratkowskyi]TXD77248.1 HAMP domain-containing histidine kinase [Algoriphagus ratkowskyi]
MKFIKKIKRKHISLPVAIVTILFIGYVDFLSGDEFAFSFFYLLPIASLSISPKTSASAIILCATLAAIEWFIAEYLTRDYTLLFFPIWNAGVRLVFFISIGLLLYYLKANEKKLKYLNSHLKSINNEKNKFIGIAAHDIKGPLGIINAFTEILIQDYKEELNPEITEILNIIKTTSSNSITVVRNLLDVSKIEAGQLVLNYKLQDYISFIINQVHINRILAKNKDIEIKLDLSKDQLFVDFDEHYFSEVIGNLLSNAIKYSNRNTEILVKVSLSNTNQVLTEVIDNGIGISESEQKSLFNYFQKTSSRPTEGEESSGLGLAISKQIISLHHGQIGVKSFKNQGSTFFYTIPLIRP